MNIGIDARALTKNKAGIGTYTYKIIEYLNKYDKKNKYILFSNKEVVIDFELNENWDIYIKDSKIGTYWVYFKLPKILKENNIDIFWGTQHCVPKRNKFTKNIKYILTIHDIAIKKLKKVGSLYNTIIQKLILKKSCKNANKIIAVSKSTKKDLIDILKINEEKIQVIYEGIEQDGNKNKLNQEQENEIIKKYGVEKNKYIFFLSTIEPRKNLITAVKAFDLLKQREKNLKFVISGGQGWKCKKTLDRIYNSKFKKDIILTGYISNEEKEAFFKNTIAFVYPSLYEGFGIPILEAMKNGAIVITSNNSSLPEVGGKSAFYLNNVHDETELSRLIEKCLNLSDQERKEIIEEGYQNVKKFTWEKCAKETLEQFNQEDNN